MQRQGLPVHLSADGTTATWNPALAAGARVVVWVRRAGEEAAEPRPSSNSGRARVRAPDRIEAITEEAADP